MNSPCKKKCALDVENKYCISCLRSIEEIRDWKILTESQREEIIRRVGRVSEASICKID